MRNITSRPFPTHRAATAVDLGNAVRAARTQSKLPLRDAALALGLAIQTLSDIERGKPGVSIGNVLKATEGLGVDLFALPKRNRTLAEARLGELLR